jgi:hypothetical protein
MLTNAYETQVVQSLGVRIGPDSAAGAAGAATSASASASGASSVAAGTGTGTGCPFTAMIPSADGVGAQIPTPMPVRWTAAAEARLANIPAFVRPMARTGIERFALERGALEVDERILDAARDFFGM